MVKKVAAIHDLSGLGKCSLTVAIPVLSVLGVQACPLPTAVLTGQTGFPSYYMDDYTDKIDYYTEEWSKAGIRFDGIYTGFLANEAQVDKIFAFIDRFQQPDTLLVVDPVMGDNGKIYDTYTAELCGKMRCLASKANVITPNLTEACILADLEYQELISHNHSPDYLDRIGDLAKKLQRLGPKAVAITGIHHKSPSDPQEMLYNAVLQNQHISYFKSQIWGNSYSGTGDIFASILCGCILQGRSLTDAAGLATELIAAAIRDAFQENIDRNHGVDFERYLYMLLETQ